MIPITREAGVLIRGRNAYTRPGAVSPNNLRFIEQNFFLFTPYRSVAGTPDGNFTKRYNSDQE